MCKVVAFITDEKREAVENRLKALSIPGINVTKVMGYGEYANLFKDDWLSPHVRLEIYLPRDRAEIVAQAIIDSARTGAEDQGIVAIEPVDALYRIGDGETA